MLIKDNCYYCGISISQINELGKKNQLYTFVFEYKSNHVWLIQKHHQLR